MLGCTLCLLEMGLSLLLAHSPAEANFHTINLFSVVARDAKLSSEQGLFLVTAAKTKIACVLQCVGHFRCASVNWSKTNHHCELNWGFVPHLNIHSGLDALIGTEFMQRVGLAIFDTKYVYR